MAARLVTMAVALVCGVVSARLVIGTAGVDEYALMTLLIALPSLISFADLGSGAVVVNSVASSDDIASDELLMSQMLSVVRITAIFVAVLTTINMILVLTGGWSVMLGTTSTIRHSTAAAATCTVLYALTMMLGLWQRVLLGLGMNPLIILLQGLISPLSLLFVFLMLREGAPSWGAFLAVSTFAATLITAIAGIVTTDRLTKPLLRTAFRRALHPRAFPGARVMNVGWPMFIQLLAPPLSIALPRFILAQTASTVALAQYALAGQVFFALQGLLVAGGMALWPAFTRARARGEVERGPYAISAAFVAIVVAATASLLIVGDWFFAIVSDGQVSISTSLILAFGATVALRALLYPLGMFMMDTQGIRFQVIPAVASTVATIGLTIALVPSLGVLGPLVASAAATFLFQIVPYIFYIRRHRARLHGLEPVA